MLIIPSKELLLITAQQSKQIFLFDPKTSSVITKYHTDPSVGKALAYYPQANQFLTSFSNKTFINIWSTDCQQSINKVSTTDLVTYLVVSNDKNILYAGTQNGNIYFWELPTGILLKKETIHSTQIKKIVEYKPGYLMTASRQQLKFWSLSSFYLQTQRSTPIKTINSILEIVDVEFIRNIFIVLTSKSVTYYLGGNQTNPFTQFNKQDMQYPTKICCSLSHVYISDCQGFIHVNQVQTKQNSYELNFDFNDSKQELQINKASKKFVLKSGNKHPITSLVHLKTLPFLISGNTEGDIFIWQSHSLKKSIKLFKTSIKFIHNISRPIQQKITQNLKIRPLAKYQMNKQTQPLQVDVSTLAKKQEGFDFQNQTEKIVEDAENQLILSRIFSILNRSDEILKSKISQLQQQKQSLFKANLHFCQMFNQQDLTLHNSQ